MNISTKENKMTVVIDFWSVMMVKIFFGVVAAFFLGIYWLLDFASPNNPKNEFGAFWVVIALASLTIAVIADGDKIYNCELDKELNKAIITKRAGWFLWLPRKSRFPLDNIVSIILTQEASQNRWQFDNGFKMYLQIRGGGRLRLESTATTKDGEAIGKFLKVPLRLELESETITIIPWDANPEATLTPTPCPSCGAPLPAIQSFMNNTTCEHCSMSFVVSWQDGHPILHDLKNKQLFQLKQ